MSLAARILFRGGVWKVEKIWNALWISKFPVDRLPHSLICKFSHFLISEFSNFLISPFPHFPIPSFPHSLIRPFEIVFRLEDFVFEQRHKVGVKGEEGLHFVVGSGGTVTSEEAGTPVLGEEENSWMSLDWNVWCISSFQNTSELSNCGCKVIYRLRNLSA